MLFPKQIQKAEFVWFSEGVFSGVYFSAIRFCFARGSLTGSTAEDRLRGKEPGLTCLDWFICFKRLHNSELTMPPIWSGKSMSAEK